MSDYSYLSICIMLFAIIIALTSISMKLSEDKCDNCPSFIDIRNNQTINYLDYDVIDKKECIEKYPMGYYHTMINGNCKITFWKSDLD